MTNNKVFLGFETKVNQVGIHLILTKKQNQESIEVMSKKNNNYEETKQTTSNK